MSDKVDKCSLLCAVQQNFAIDPEYNDDLERLENEGLIEEVRYWVLTHEGEEELARLSMKESNHDR